MFASDMTILTCSPYHRAAKTAIRTTSGPGLEPYRAGKWFAVSQRRATDISELSAILSELEGDFRVMVIRGEPFPATNWRQTRKTKLPQRFGRPQLRGGVVSLLGPRQGHR
jgi:hypothetical protein